MIARLIKRIYKNVSNFINCKKDKPRVEITIKDINRIKTIHSKLMDIGYSYSQAKEYTKYLHFAINTKSGRIRKKNVRYMYKLHSKVKRGIKNE